MKRILIIEDDQGIAELERDYLEANGFSTDIAADGKTGEAKALGEAFDLILLDIMLPGRDGFQICRTIRETKDIPILIVSARQEDIDKIRGLGLGADDYIVKPFSPNELVARVKGHLARYEQLTSREVHRHVLRYGDLEIDESGHRVFVKGKEVALPNKEFELLLFFAKNSARKPSSIASGAAKPWGKRPPCRFMSTASVKKSKKIRPTPAILKRSGAQATASEAELTDFF